MLSEQGCKIMESVDTHALALGALSALPDSFVFGDFQEVTGFKRTKGSEMLRWLMTKEFLSREKTRFGFVYVKRYD